MYNIKMVSKLLDLSPVTIRAWENRYHVIQPKRNDSGHRIYSDQDIEDLRWLLKQTKEHGLSIKHAADKLKKNRENQQKATDSGGQQVQLFSPSIMGSYQEQQVQLYEALLAYDLEKAHHLVDIGFSSHDFETMMHQIFVPLMVQVGDDWEKGVISVAEEHMISEFIKQRILQFYRIFQRNPRLPQVIAACPSGERHEMGLLLFSIFLRRKGFDVLYLGADTPPAGVIELANKLDTQYLCLSSSNEENIDSLMIYIDEIKSQCPHLQFLLGGTGIASISNSPYITKIGDHLHEWENWYEQFMKHY